MEQEEVKNEEFEKERFKVMMENFQVFGCSGSLEHEPDCDGNCEVETLDALDIAIYEETQKWVELGMTPLGSIHNTQIPGVPIDTFHLDNSHVALLNIIQEKGIATQEEMDEMYKKVKLERMTKIRERNQEAILAARRSRIAVPGNALPQIEIPDYMKRKMQ